ncbi:MAG: helix-turn-helix transcriptional regulator [Clostridiales bacterium]|nr:helix-turn-helix transcriptional regulator [Clostridiales bacterium]
METGKKLKKLRLEKGLKQSELASALNVSDKLISKWETGISVPSTEFTLMLCEFFDIDVSEFLGTKNQTPKRKKALSKKQKLALYISGGVLAFYILFSLIYFVIVPFSCKTGWLNDIDTRIQNVLDRGYYSFEISATIDGKTTKQTENAKIQDGVLYYERLSQSGGVLSSIVGNVEYDGNKSYKVFDKTPQNLSEIIFHADSDDEMASLVKNIDANYILQTVNGYKMSVKGFSVSNAVTHGKVIADVIFNGDYFEKLNVYFTLKKDGKFFDCTGSITFDLNAPPKDITLYEHSYIKWSVQPTYSLSELTEEQLGGKITTNQINNNGYLLSAGDNLVFCGNTSVDIYDGKTLTLKKQLVDVIDDDIYNIYTRNRYTTDTHLYISEDYDNKILKIDLETGETETIVLPEPDPSSVYVLPNGSIYYSIYNWDENSFTFVNHTTGNTILGEPLFFDGTYVYTEIYEDAPKNLTIRKYDINDNLIAEFNNLSASLGDKIIASDDENFYFNYGQIDASFTNGRGYIWVNNFSSVVYAKHGNRLFSNRGIIYTDKFIPPIPISDILNAFELDNYIVLIDRNNTYYSIEK